MLTKTPFQIALIALVVLFPSTVTAAPSSQLPAGDDARVIRVVNGDSFEVVINNTPFTIGLSGVDAPNPATKSSKDECFAREATNYLKRLVQGKTIRLEREDIDFDAAGRLMRFAYLPDGRQINELLLQEGMAKIDPRTTGSLYSTRLQSAEGVAKSKTKGLWKSCSTALNVPNTATAKPTDSCNTVTLSVKVRQALNLYEQWAVDEAKKSLVPVLTLADQTCVIVNTPFSNGTTIWLPAGSIVQPDKDFIALWPDGQVTVFKGDQGQWRATSIIYRFGDNKPPIMDMTDGDLDRRGDGNRFLALPASKSFVLEDLGNNQYRATVGILQLASGSLPRLPEIFWKPR